MSQEKNELFPIEELPSDLITLIARHLDKTDEPQVRKSERRQHFPIFRSVDIQTNRILAKLGQYAAQANIKQIAALLKIRPDLRLDVLFTLAGLGAQDEMQVILKTHPEDLLKYYPLRDISGAEFKSITLFQHALWAKDVRYMAPMMLKCLPQNDQGEQIRIKLLHQYDELMDKGVVYSLHGVKHEGEHHFNLKPLIAALLTYLNEYNNQTQKENKTHWCTVVGFEQTLLPAHIRHHYCDKEISFRNNPSFTAETLKRSLEIYNCKECKLQLWGEFLVGLGSQFGIGSDQGTEHLPHRADAGVLTTLDETRTKDILALKELLDTAIQKPKANVGCVGIP